MVRNWSVWVVRCLHPYAHMSVHTVCRRTYVRVSLRELLNPFLACSEHALPPMVSTHYTRTGPLFPFGHFAPDWSAIANARAYPAIIGHMCGGTRRHAHITCRSCLWVNGPPMAHRSPTMEVCQESCAALGRLLSVRRHPIYSTFFLTLKIFSEIFFMTPFTNMGKMPVNTSVFKVKKFFERVFETLIFEMSSLQNKTFCALIGGGDTPRNAGHTPICHFSPNFLFYFIRKISSKNSCTFHHDCIYLHP